MSRKDIKKGKAMKGSRLSTIQTANHMNTLCFAMTSSEYALILQQPYHGCIDNESKHRH